MKKNIPNKIKPTSASIMKEMQEKIAELEQTINSIQQGKVDALVINTGNENPTVFALKGSDEPYRVLIENLSEGAVTVNEEGKVIHCNKHFCNMVKAADINIMNTSLADYLLPEQHGLLDNLLDQTLKAIHKSEFTLLASDNSQKTVLFSCQALKFGKFNSIVIVVTDISEIKADQLETYRAKERYRILMDNASCGVIVYAIDGKIIEVNKQTETIFGESRNEIFKNNVTHYVIPEERNKLHENFKKLIIEKKVGPEEVIIKTPNGEIKIIEYSAVSVGTGFTRENLLLLVINDITESKKLANQTLLNDKLATIGTLSAGIVHEINNPMTWIIGNLRYLKKQMTGLEMNDDKKVESFIGIIDETLKGTGKIQDIVKNLKGFARKDEDLSATPVDINEVLNSAIAMASHQIKDIAKLETNFDENLPKLLLSGNRLHQVFLNLIVNAIQAFSEKNSANIIRINTIKEENDVRIDIADTGPGISADKLPHIFDIFFTTKPVGIGTGLGLSICHDIINHEGGEIKVKSSLGKGTIFSVYLPLQKPGKPERIKEYSNES